MQAARSRKVAAEARVWAAKVELERAEVRIGACVCVCVWVSMCIMKNVTRLRAPEVAEKKTHTKKRHQRQKK